MEKDIIIETQRTYLRKVCQEDFREIAGILGDAEVMYAWEHGFSDDEIHEWIKECLMRYTRDGYSYWAVILKSTGKLIGVCGVIAEEADKQKYVGIGYIFRKAFWNQGFAFECASACKDYAFNTLKMPLLTAQIRPNNISSKKVAEKLGMAVIKKFKRIYRGKMMPHLLYGCSK